MSVTELIHFDKDGNIEAGPAYWVFRRLFLALVILLVALLSFGLGRLSTTGGGEGVSIRYDPSLGELAPKGTSPATQTAAAVKSLPSAGTPAPDNANPPATASQAIVASKNSTKYHYSYCPGAKTIREGNRIYFASAAEAEAAGLVLAGNCHPR